ncbi:MAG: hypothetical protein C7M88_10195 [Candidatus Arcticimaribacter sp.]|nr:MAG: hypothetical protein C7M88_10195 [Candidatus Arcticimaribacter sp.]
MSVLNENTIIGASGAGTGDYEIEQSLRFNDDDTSYLTRTPSAASNRKTWTWSGWVKRGNLGGTRMPLFDAYQSSSGTMTQMMFTNTDILQFYTSIGGIDYSYETLAVFRDPSAWYHIVVVLNTVSSTQQDRFIVYVNGERQANANQYGALDLDVVTYINSTEPHNIGKASDQSYFADGYMGEVNFIDGQALTPDSFGETGIYGEWKPIAYDGTYGTNGFYLPFEQDYTVEGFSTVTYEGKGVGQYIGGTGFSPSLTWIKARNQTYDHHLFDVIRGPLNRISSNSTSAESSMTNSLTAFNTDGFTLGDTAQVNLNNGEFVAWNWDMGGTTASNTSGSITSSVRANTAYGQSIVSYTGTGSAATIGHGLASAPEFWLVKNRSVVKNWAVGTTQIPATNWMQLEQTGGSDSGTTVWNSTYPSTSSINIGTATVTNASGQDYIAYCWHSVTGYSKFGSYSGNGSSTGPVVTTGFNPAFVMIKRSSSTGGWIMLDNTRSAGPNPINHKLQADDSGAEDVDTSWNISFLSNGFQLGSNHVWMNASGSTYIYAAFADTREYAYWYDQSGNNNDWTSEGGLTESDVMVDSPTNNFATFNPIHDDTTGTSTEVFSQGNLRVGESGTGWSNIFGSQGMPSGKWYWEAYMVGSGTVDCIIGIAKTNWHRGTDGGIDTAGAYSIYTASDGNLYSFNSGSSTNEGSGVAFTWGDILQVAYDADTGKLWFGKNNTWLFSGNPSTGSTPKMTVGASDTGNMLPAWSQYHAANAWAVNFGSDSSFSGVKTPQGNQDSNDIGDFFYAPPTGFLSLCTKSLPDVDVIPSEHFNTVLYTGNGANRSISGVGFGSAPDFVWIKNRSSGNGHQLLDVVRGATKHLSSNTDQAQSTAVTGLTSFDSDGFSLGTATGVNTNGDGFVAWNWKAGGSASTLTTGTIDSVVSANPSAGFSIVKYVGNNTANATIAHGLSQTPTFIITKNMTNSAYWATYLFNDANKKYYINASSSDAATWITPASALITLVQTNANNVNESGSSYINYCFHSVDGHSRVGQYTGNGNSDGTFVNCGFRPKYVLIRRNLDAFWNIFDTERGPYNMINNVLWANGGDAETVSANWNIDLLSNGFKQRGTHDYMNDNGETFFFIAFAETPFKFSNAR